MMMATTASDVATGASGDSQPYGLSQRCRSIGAAPPSWETMKVMPTAPSSSRLRASSASDASRWGKGRAAKKRKRSGCSGTSAAH